MDHDWLLPLASLVLAFGGAVLGTWLSARPRGYPSPPGPPSPLPKMEPGPAPGGMVRAPFPPTSPQPLPQPHPGPRVSTCLACASGQCFHLGTAPPPQVPGLG